MVTGACVMSVAGDDLNPTRTSQQQWRSTSWDPACRRARGASAHWRGGWPRIAKRSRASYRAGDAASHWPRLDRLDRLVELAAEHTLSDQPEQRADHAPLEVLALAHDDHVDAGRTVGPPLERVGVPGRPAPGVRVCRRHADAIGV